MILAAVRAHAFNNQAVYGGLGYFLENNYGKLTTSSNSAPSTLGTADYPLFAKYDLQLTSYFYLSPQFNYTLLTRSDPSNSATVTIWQLMLPFGGNIGSSSFDWSMGPGLLNRNISGSGGTQTLNNGSSTSTFSLPGRSVTIQTYTVDLGVSWSSGPSRIGFDLITEGTLTNKRTIDMMLSYSYAFFGASK